MYDNAEDLIEMFDLFVNQLKFFLVVSICSMKDLKEMI